MDYKYKRVEVLLKKLQSLINKKVFNLDGFLYKECGYCDVNEFPELETLSPYDGCKWGEERDNHVWFVKDVVVPDDFDLENSVVKVDTYPDGWFWGNPQFIVYVDGKIQHALDYKHWDFPVGEKKRFNLSLYGYVGKYIAGGNDEQSVIKGDIIFKAYLIEKDKLTEKLYYDIFVPFSALNCIDESTKEYSNILNGIDKAVDMIDFRTPYSDEYYFSVKSAVSYMDNFYQRQKSGAGIVSLIGQTHIDVAWLWTKRQVREKAIRSFTTALELLDRYPDYKFMMCQPALYEFVKKDAPDIFAKIKQKVQEGRWEANGGLYVENDFNLTSGESIVRQLFYADKFFTEEFGKKSNVCWVPDSFGFSGSMPQIFEKAGIKFFITSKLSWNETDTMPYDTFLWKGIDGSSVMAYLLTAQDKRLGISPERFTIYNAVLSVPQVMGTFERYQQKGLNDNVILTYGFGDGGGGPTAEYLEIMDRLNRGVTGVPATESLFLGEFVKRIYSRLKDEKLLPTWCGELYFEHHRGVYTSVTKLKKNNRKAEFALKDAEQESVISGELFNTEYPQDVLEQSWKSALINQFHDVLPGSSIKEVYDETDEEYAKTVKRDC